MPAVSCSRQDDIQLFKNLVHTSENLPGELRSDGCVYSVREGGGVKEEIPESSCCSNSLWGFYSQVSNNA